MECEEGIHLFVEEPCEVFIIYLFVPLFVWFWILGSKEAILLPHRVLLELLLGSSKHVSLFLVLFFSSQFTHCSQINTIKAAFTILPLLESLPALPWPIGLSITSSVWPVKAPTSWLPSSQLAFPTAVP